MNDKKITIIITDFGIGGAEKNILKLSDDWIGKGFDITLLLLNKRGELISKISEKVKVKVLDKGKIRNALFEIYKYIKKEEEHIVWVNLWPLTSIGVMAWLMAGKKGSIFITEHNNLMKSYAGKNIIKKMILYILIKLTHKRATGISVVSNGLRNELQKIDNSLKEKIIVINNPVVSNKIEYTEKQISELKKELWGGDNYINILTVGELKLQKNHEMLIEAIKNINDELRVKVRIVGPGSLMDFLNRKIMNYKLENVIKLEGYQYNTSKWYASSDIFILTSNWEGFGNVLVEAMEYGLSIISTDCPSGPREILNEGQYGILIECNDVVGLQNAIKKALNQKNINKPNIIKRSKIYEVRKISEQYLSLFKNQIN
jgi:glycosyltransferase involved in cell wall biosynthesis